MPNPPTVRIDGVPATVGPVGHEVEHVEGAVQREGHERRSHPVLGAAARPARGDAGGAAVYGEMDTSGRVVDAEPLRIRHSSQSIRELIEGKGVRTTYHMRAVR